MVIKKPHNGLHKTRNAFNCYSGSGIILKRNAAINIENDATIPRQDLFTKFSVFTVLTVFTVISAFTVFTVLTIFTVISVFTVFTIYCY